MIGSKEIANTVILLGRDPSASSEKIAKNIISYLRRNNRLDLFPEVLRIVENESNHKEIENSIIITTPHKTKMIDKISKFISSEGDKTTVAKINESLLGGFIAEHQNVVYDASVKRKLELLKKRLIQN